jgi:LysM repeat protein
MARTRRLLQLAVAVATLCVCGTAWAATKFYVVRPNEGWYQVAKSHGVTVKELLAANHSTLATKLHAGQRLQMPTAAHAKPAKRLPMKTAAKPQPQHSVH